MPSSVEVSLMRSLLVIGKSKGEKQMGRMTKIKDGRAFVCLFVFTFSFHFYSFSTDSTASIAIYTKVKVRRSSLLKSLEQEKRRKTQTKLQG